METNNNQLNNMQKRLVILSILTLFLLWGMSLPHGNLGELNNQRAGLTDLSEENYVRDPFSDINVQARAYLIFDFKGNIIASKNSDLQWPLASLTKLMTALIVKDFIADDDVIEISLDAIKREGDDGFFAGELFSKNDLLNIMLVRSSNDSAYAFAEHVGIDKFIEMMNAKAKDLGMVETYFLNPSGLDVSSSVSGAYGSADDLMILIKYIMARHPDIFEATRNSTLSVSSVQGKLHEYVNTNRVVDDIPDVIGGKTGFTDIAGGHLIVLADVGIHNPIGMIVMGSSEDGRFEDMLKLYQAARDHFYLE